ncbi:MAG: [NiFe]-hydrogenase assembly chaperone HybE [Gammaproteobacteria bacterium]
MRTDLEKLVSDYQRIADERMRGLPVYNDRLTVEAVDFRKWDGHQLGVLITPWFINLVLLPADTADRSDFDYGTKTQREFPSGRYEFDTCNGAETGIHQSAVLFSTVADFPDQNTAREIAREVMVYLFQRNGGQEEKQPPGTPPVSESLMEKEMSRRDLFRWLVPDTDDGGRPRDA